MRLSRGWALVCGVVFIFLLLTAPALAFPDVPDSHPYSEAIADLSGRGIIGGYTNGNFGPGDPVIRQQFAKMVVKTLGLTVTGSEACPFVDVLPGTGTDPFYPTKYVAVCAQNNITKGTDSTHFSPTLNIRRQQVITMIVRALDNLQPGTLQAVPAGWSGVLPAGDPTHGGNIKKAEYNGLLNGIRASASTSGLAGWDTTKNASRGEVAQMLHNLLSGGGGGTLAEEDAALLRYEGDWSQVASAGSSGGRHKVLDGPGSLSVGFHGSSISLLAPSGPNAGILKVFLDGVRYPDIDLYSAAPAAQVKVLTITSADMAHALRLEWSGKKAASSAGTAVSVDALQIGGVSPGRPTP